MSQQIYIAGLKPLAGGVTTPASTTASQAFVIPTTAPVQRGRRYTLEVIASIRGTAPVWVRYDGVDPTVGTGIELGTTTAAAPIIVRLRGQAAIEGFRVISAGGTWTYQFFCDDLG